MFEFESFLGREEQGIALQTRLRRDIPNIRGLALTDSHIQRFNKLVLKHVHWEIRKPPCGEYNCAGHVWASRRTCIYEPNAWDHILEDDGFRKTDSPISDDLVLYTDPKCGILHIGRVVSLAPGFTREGAKIPWIVSKWDDTSGEVCHSVFDHPFGTVFDVSIEYRTDRPRTSERGLR